jgi:hypothetical protein
MSVNITRSSDGSDDVVAVSRCSLRWNQRLGQLRTAWHRGDDIAVGRDYRARRLRVMREVIVGQSDMNPKHRALAANSAAKRADTDRYWAYNPTRQNGSDKEKQQ